MIPLLAACGAVLLVAIVALVLHRALWRDRYVSGKAGCELRGQIVGPGAALDVVATADVHGRAEARDALLVRAQGNEVRVDVHGAQLELRWRAKRGADLRVGDRVAVWGLGRAGDVPCAATRVLRAGWPGLLPLCVATTLGVVAAVATYRLVLPSGCPAGTQPRLRSERTLQERACVRADGLRHGPAVETTHGGRLLASGSYREGRLDGVWRRYYRNGKLAERVSYRAGLRHGAWQRFAPDGALTGRAEMDRGRGVFIGLHRDGTTSERGVIVGGEREGRWMFFGRGGALTSEGSYARGKKQGRWRSWHQGGKLAWEATFSRGKKHGRWRAYTQDGVVEEEGAFEHGRRSGHWRFYHDSGKLAREGSFVDGKEDGPWTLYDGAGQTQIEGRYQRGRRVGSWRWYCGRCKDCDVCSAAQRAAKQVVSKDYDPTSSRPAGSP